MSIDKQIYYNVKGNPFLYRNIDIKFISPLDAGYIITPNGEFIPVKDGDDHSTVFSEYLTYYLDRNINLETMEAITLLVQYKHIVYMGIKLRDMKEIYTANAICEGLGLLIFPENIENSISEDQKKSCLALIASNKKRIGTGEIITIQYYSLSNSGVNSIEYSKEKILDILKRKNQTKQLN